MHQQLWQQSVNDGDYSEAPMTTYLQQHLTQTTTQQATPQPSDQTESSNLSASEVGAAFALQYFKIMKSRPEDLPRFYSTESRVSRIAPGPGGAMEFRHATGPLQIAELLYKEHGCGSPLYVAIINLIECQDTISGGVFIQLTGTLKYVDDTSRDFNMSILLLRQDHPPGQGYYILNDVFVFQQPPHRAPCFSMSASDNADGTVTRAQQQQQQQQPRLSQTAPKPVTAPVAATAQPAAAPLPTTTAPRLSSPAQPSTPRLDLNSKEAGENTHDVSPSSEGGMPQLQELGEAQGDPAAPVVVENTELPEVLKDVENKTKTVTDRPNTTAVPVLKSAWQTITPVEVDDADVFETKQVVANKGSRDNENQSSQRKSQDPVDPGRTTTTVAPRVPDASLYSKNSYAGALLLSGALRTPCRVGYSIPRPAAETRARAAVTPADNVVDGDGAEGEVLKKPAATGGNFARPGKLKTLWVSLLPSDMSDEKIKKSVAEQLKGQAAEGHVVRIERIPGHVHGYIELDTELCAKILVEKGLHLQGREVSVAYPGRTFRGARPTSSRRAPRNNTANVGMEGDERKGGRVAKDNSYGKESVDEGWVSASRRKTTKQGGNGPRPTGNGSGVGAARKSAPRHKNPKNFPEESVRPVVQPVN